MQVFGQHNNRITVTCISECSLNNVGNTEKLQAKLLVQFRGYLSFPLMFSLNLLNSVTKIFVITVKRLETCHPATSCVRDQDAITAPATYVRARIFKLNPIHASLIYQSN